jgi:hypothetical protein
LQSYHIENTFGSYEVFDLKHQTILSKTMIAGRPITIAITKMIVRHVNYIESRYISQALLYALKNQKQSFQSIVCKKYQLNYPKHRMSVLSLLRDCAAIFFTFQKYHFCNTSVQAISRLFETFFYIESIYVTKKGKKCL